jgi:hypothetical protein
MRKILIKFVSFCKHYRAPIIVQEIETVMNRNIKLKLSADWK